MKSVDFGAYIKAQFFNTSIPACLWFLRRGKSKQNDKVLFVDASELGFMINRKNRVLADDDVSNVAKTYHKWLSRADDYEDVKGFCKSASIEDIQKHKFALTPEHYVEVPDEEDDGIPFQEKVDTLTSKQRTQMNEAQVLDKEIAEQLAKIGITL